MMLSQSKRRIALLFVALLTLIIVSIATLARSAIAEAVTAISHYAYELIPEPDVPTSCRNPNRLCLWAKTSDGLLYYHKADGTNVSLSAAGIFSVRDFGARGDGRSDDTVAIDAACVAARTGGIVSFPAGRYRYSGSGCTGSSMKFSGAGKDSSEIVLGARKYLVDDNQRWASFQMRGIRFEGGAGAVRNRFTGVNVANYKEIDDCYFNNFTDVAISSNSTDDPYWKITRSIFAGADNARSIGIALSGLTDGDTIQDCEFISFKVGIKLGRGGNNAHVVDSSFLQFREGVNRAALWIVPEKATVNAGQGLVISNIKFGNENLAASDYRILYADEGVGEYFGDRLWAKSQSTGRISGHRVHSILVNGAGDHMQPLVYSYTSNIESSHYGPLTVGGTPPNYIVQISTPPTQDVGATNYENVIGPIAMANSHVSAGLSGWKASNAPSMFTVVDPAHVFNAADPDALVSGGVGAGPAGYTNLLTASVRSFVAAGRTKSVEIRDAAAGVDAAEVTLPKGGSFYRPVGSALNVGEPIWIEFDMMAGGARPLSTIQLRVQKNGTEDSWWRRSLAIPATGWKRFRFSYLPRAVPPEGFAVSFANTAADLGAVKLGRVHVYQAFEPLSGGQLDGLWNDGGSTFRGPVRVNSSVVGTGNGGVDLSAMAGTYQTPRGKATFYGSSNRFVNQLQFGTAEQAYSGTLTPRYGKGLEAHRDAVLWRIGLASGEAKVTFKLRVSVNRSGTPICVVREINFTAIGTTNHLNSVAAVGRPNTSLVLGEAGSDDFDVDIAVASNQLIVKIRPRKWVSSYVATGSWESPDIGGGGELVYEN